MNGSTAYDERAITRAYVTKGHVAGIRSTGHRLHWQATFGRWVLFCCCGIIMASGGSDVILALTLWSPRPVSTSDLHMRRNNGHKDKAFAWVRIMGTDRMRSQCLLVSCEEKIWDEGELAPHV